MSFIGAFFLGALLFGSSSKCNCPTCKKVRAKRGKEYQKWLKSRPSVSSSISPSVLMSTSTSLSPSQEL